MIGFGDIVPAQALAEKEFFFLTRWAVTGAGFYSGLFCSTRDRKAACRSRASRGGSMPERILFVDDEKFVLATFRRNLCKQFEVDTAEGGLEALRQCKERGPYAVVVSDLKMPRMDGIELLRRIRDLWPDTVRIMLTGHGDLDAAMAAVNQGAIFRFLTKPCAPDALLAAVTDGLRQYRLITAEKELLRGTLRGCIQVMSELLTLVSPEAFGRGERAKGIVVEICQMMGLDGLWRYELAAMLSQIGCISLPPEILERKMSGGTFSPEEAQIFLMHPAIAGNLLRNIPRLESVAEMVAGQELSLDKNPSLGARILKVALDYTDRSSRGEDDARILAAMRAASTMYDTRIVGALEYCLGRRAVGTIRPMLLVELREGMVLAEDVRSGQGAVLLEKGQTITPAALERFINFGTILGIKEPVHVVLKENERG